MIMKHFAAILLLLVGALSAVAQEQRTKPVYYFNPDWSPGDKRIVFESTKDGKFAIYTIKNDGSDLKKLTSGDANDEQPRWSPDGKQIVFISDRDDHLQLYLMNADGSNQRRLTNSSDIDYLPDFSPDGKRVVFMSRKDRSSAIHDIYSIRTDGTQRTQLTVEATNEMSPLWSPNGKLIVFERNIVPKPTYREMSRDEVLGMRLSQELYIMNSDGSGIVRLTDNKVAESGARWARDGKRIYFVSEREGSPNVYSMKPDGTDVRKIADGKIVSNPNISRNGKRFVYSKEVDKKWAIYIFDIRTGKERVIFGEASN
jgi:Tol biopolymer transport system component